MSDFFITLVCNLFVFSVLYVFLMISRLYVKRPLGNGYGLVIWMSVFTVVLGRIVKSIISEVFF